MSGSNSDIARNDKNREQTEHATASDQVGSGSAKAATKAVEKNKNRKSVSAAQNAARKAMGLKPL